VAALRAGLSVLELRRMLAQELGLVTPGDFALRQAERRRHAWHAIHRTLRRELLPRPDDRAGARTPAAAALRALAVVDERRETRRLGRAARGMVAALAPGQPADAGDGDIASRLAAAVRAAFAARGRAAAADPELAPLRALVGRAAQLSLGMWP
jgi:hypothetical protein